MTYPFLVIFQPSNRYHNNNDKNIYHNNNNNYYNPEINGPQQIIIIDNNNNNNYNVTIANIKDKNINKNSDKSKKIIKK